MLPIAVASLAALFLPYAGAADTVVQVGRNGLRFDPQFVSASTGDTITFVFNPKAHSVTQSSFATPCSPAPDGIDTGLVPVAAGSTDFVNKTVTIDQTDKPTWFYCKQQGPPNHCQAGMVFAVNAPTSGEQTFEAFQARAQSGASSSGSASTTSPASAPSSPSVFTTPPPPSIVTVTATVTAPSSTWTTTYGSWEGSPPPTPAAQPQDHKVLVGENNGLTFNPTNIFASIGDTVTFEFRTKNHTATRSSFLRPCQPQIDTTPDATATFFDSGFLPVQGSNLPTFQFRVNDTAPIWVYCKQGTHCGSGMVFSVNAIESGPYNFAAFQGLARQINGTSASSPSGSTSGTASAPGPSSTGAPSAAMGLPVNGVPATLLAVVAGALAFAL